MSVLKQIAERKVKIKAFEATLEINAFPVSLGNLCPGFICGLYSLERIWTVILLLRQVLQ